MALNRPFKNGLLLKGAYTYSRRSTRPTTTAGSGLSWNQPSQIDRNYARAGYDRPHMLQMGFVYELPWMRESSGVLPMLVKNWQINGIASCRLGYAVLGRRRQRPAPAGRRLSRRPTSRASSRVASATAGPNEPWYDPTAFSQPGNAWGNSGRNAFRGPANWNLDFSLFRSIPIGRYRVEFRAESTNVFNHTQWGNPVTGLTDPNFMRIRSLARNPRRIQLGARFAF